MLNKEKIQKRLIKSLAEALYLEPSEIDADQSFIDLGLDSIVGVEWIKTVNKDFGLELSSTKVYDYSTVNKLTAFLEKELADKPEENYQAIEETAPEKDVKETLSQPQYVLEKPISTPTNVLKSFPSLTRKKRKNHVKKAGNGFEDEKIAIVGMSGRYPEAKNLNEYWENLKVGKNSVVEIPPSRWDVDKYYDPDPTKPGKVYSKWLGMLDDVDCFDPLFFQISPAEAESMDPQHRLFLEESYKAFEDAGYARNTLSDKKCGVYMGIMSNEYSIMLSKGSLNTVNTTANSFAIGAARISYFMNLKGPAIPFDTACSSSLVAIHTACQSLLNNEIDMALAGGVSLYLIPESYIGMCQAGMLSPEGQCKTFDDSADGFVPGEGAGAVVLKRLKDAERDNDHIYGVIIGSGINQDGKTNGITAPSVNSQIELERDIYSRYNIDPATISYVEAHGTGTKLGDPIELEALSTVFQEKTSKENFCAIGSVKSNIGHTSGAAGVASLQKVLLCMQNKTLVPSLNVKKENAIFDFKNSPFYISREKKTWNNLPDSDHSLRRAAISSFGFSGTNAHLVVEEYPQKQKSGKVIPNAGLIIPLSARTKDQLKQKAVDLLDLIKSKSSSINLVDMAYTLQVGREVMRARLCIVVNSLSQLQEKLELFIEGKSDTENLYLTQANKSKDAISFFEAEADFSKLVISWIKDRNNSKLAEIWVNGYDIDWNKLYDNTKPNRVNLPTYPFAKERYWPQLQQNTKIFNDQQEYEASNSFAPAVAEQISKLHFYSYWKEAELAKKYESDKQLKLEGPILILDTNEELYQAYKSKFSQDENTTVFVRLANDFSIKGPNSFSLNPKREDHFYQLVMKLEEENLLPSKIIHEGKILKPIDQKDSVIEQLNVGLYPLFYLCKALMGLKQQKPLKILSVFLNNFTLNDPLNEAIAGFFKTLMLENPKYTAKVVGIKNEKESNPISVDQKLNIILSEFKDDNWTKNDVNFRYHIEANKNKRFVRTLKLYTPSKNKLTELPVKQHGVYLISGGIGGLGYLFSEYLVKKYQCNLVLFGRSALKTKQQEKLDKLKAYNTEILYLQADVTNFEDVKAVVNTAKDKFSQINGVIHSAGLNRDSFILKKSTEEIQQVIGPKILGTINLDRATKNEKLDHFVLFSSIASALGNLGQSDYAYANHFLDSFAETRDSMVAGNKRYGKTLSINWPYWEEGGFDLPENEIAQGKEFLGIHPIQTETGLEYYEEFLCSEYSQGVALYGNLSKINAYVYNEPQVSVVNSEIEPASIDETLLLEKTEAYVKEVIGKEIKLDPERIDSEEQFDAFGIDSIVIGRLNVSLENDLGPLSKTLFYEHSNIKELSEHLYQEAKQQLIRLFGISEKKTEIKVSTGKVVDSQTKIHYEERPIEKYDEHEPIAIIGVHGIYPQSEDLNSYWENLKQGKDLISLVPESRWNYKEFYHEDPEKAAEGKIYCKWGGFVNDVDKFDPQFFNITGEEAKMMDPQERLFLESVWATIEDAGYTKNSLRSRYSKGKGADVGVFVGVTTQTYNLLATDEWNKGNYLNSSSMPWSIANRVSYLMDFQGPSMPIDTACSSSLVAIHLACESLRKQECQVAVAGGVNLYLHQSKFHSLCKKRMVALGGKNYSFGAGDDGFVPGEGVGSILLKPLSKAIKDKDHIYAVVKGSSFAHSGSSNGYSAPNPNSQSTLIDETLQRAGVHPETISYVEGHGTGTQLGDSLEILALTNAFKKQIDKKQFCPVGSVKANIGHTESAAGIAGVTKILLQLKHKQLAPTINSEEINPNIDFDKTPFYLQHSLSPWKSLSNAPRRALINSFGAGGVNSCLVIEEFNSDVSGQHKTPEVSEPRLLVLSAKNKEGLLNYVNRLLLFLGENSKISIADLAYTLQVGREDMQERLAIISNDVANFMEQLKKWKQNKLTDDIYEGNSESGRVKKKSPKYEDNYINFLFKEQNLQEIARVWIEGVKLDWDKLYPDKRTPQRISVPSYPFAKERYWITDNVAKVKQANTPPMIKEQIHPLVSNNISTLHQIGFNSILSDKEYYAEDHQVNETKVFPGSGFIEIAGISGNLAGEKKVHKIKEIVWIHPLTFENGSQLVQTYLKQNGSGVNYMITSFNEENEQVTHSEGKIFYQNGVDHTNTVEEKISIEALKAQCTAVKEGSEFYDSFTKAGFRYGPSFQTVKEFFVSDSFALAKLEISDGLKSNFDQFILHPSILDGALQTVAGLMGSLEPETPYLPFAIDELEMVRPLTHSCYAYVEFADQDKHARANVKKFNIHILNRKGTLLVKVKNFYARAFAEVETAIQEV
jgi:polyketide synthase PksL